MHRFRSGIVGIVLAGFFAGCGGSTVDEGPKPFTSTDTTSLQPMVKEMQDTMKKNNYTQKAVPAEDKKKEKKK